MSKKFKILYFSTYEHELRVDREFRAITEKVDPGLFEMISVSGMQASNIQTHISTHRPEIIHFSGHSNPDKISTYDKSKTDKGISKKALIEFFRILPKKPVLVFFNSCQSAVNLGRLSRYIDFVVATRLKVIDRVAADFAPKFYESLSPRTSVKSAFDLAKNQFDMSGRKDEVEMYKLFVRKGVDTDKPLVERLPDNTKPIPKKKKSRKRNFGGKTVVRIGDKNTGDVNTIHDVDEIGSITFNRN